MTAQFHEPVPNKASEERISGSCLCGACKYTVANQPIFSNICHCLSCKKWTGSAFVMNVWFAKSSFVLEGDTASHIKMYADTKTDSGRTIEHYFCGTCGSSMWNASPNAPDRLTLASGSIDGLVGEAVPESEEERLKGMSPRMELYCKRKAPFIDISAEMQSHQEMPGARL